MRKSMAFVTTIVAIGVIVACDGSSTAPAHCDLVSTTASFVDGEQLTGIVTQMTLASGSSANAPVQIVEVNIHQNPDFTIYFTVSGETAVFERTGSASPSPSSLCRLTVGERVQIPSAAFANGFGDYVPISGNDPAPPLPPDIGQIVIVR